MLEPARYIEIARLEGERLAEIGRGGDLRAAVPATPDWDLGALVAHTGFVHRYISAWMDAGEPQGRDVVPDPPTDVVGWYADGLEELMSRLEAADPDERATTFIGPATNTFWLRRTTHENTIHRHDGEETTGRAAVVPTDVAIDGIDEFLIGFHLPHRVGRKFTGGGETLHFHATDGEGEWFLTRTADGVDVERRHGKADVAARGAAHDLLMFVWSRADTAPLEVFGDDSLLAAWQQTLNP